MEVGNVIKSGKMNYFKSIGVDCEEIIYKYAHNINMKTILDEYMPLVRLYSYGIYYSCTDYDMLMRKIKAKTDEQKKDFIILSNDRYMNAILK